MSKDNSNLAGSASLFFGFSPGNKRAGILDPVVIRMIELKVIVLLKQAGLLLRNIFWEINNILNDPKLMRVFACFQIVDTCMIDEIDSYSA